MNRIGRPSESLGDLGWAQRLFCISQIDDLTGPRRQPFQAPRQRFAPSFRLRFPFIHCLDEQVQQLVIKRQRSEALPPVIFQDFVTCDATNPGEEIPIRTEIAAPLNNSQKNFLKDVIRRRPIGHQPKHKASYCRRMLQKQRME
nr:hypothetical protein [Anatilimnocola aggregata]